MKFHEILPNFFSIAINKKHEFWNTEIDWDLIEPIERIGVLYDEEMAIRKLDLDSEIEVTEALCKDLLGIKKEAFGPYESLLMFLHFETSTILINNLAIRKVLNLGYDWIANSLSEELKSDVERSPDPKWLLIFLTNTHEYIRKYWFKTFTLWTRNLFYCCRATGAHKELVDFYLINFYGYLKSQVNPAVFYLDLMMSFVDILGWANKNRIDYIREDSAKVLLYYYNHEGFPKDWKKIIALQLSTNGYQFTELSRKEWSERVINNWKLEGHDRLQVLLNKYSDNGQEFIDHIEEITDAISEYHQFLEDVGLTGKYFNYELSRIFTLLEEPIVRLLNEGRTRYVTIIIGLFFKISQHHLIAPKNLVILPSTEKGVLYSSEGKIYHTLRDPFQFVPQIIDILNSFLSTTQTLNDVPEFRPFPLAREANTPKPELGNSLENIIADYYDLQNPKVSEFITGHEQFYLLNGHQLPLQPLFIKYGNVTLPITFSFLRPLALKKIKSVLMWQGDAMLSERECDAVEDFFLKNNILVRRLNFHHSSKEEFLLQYRGDFDLVWISCHGQFDHYKPHESYLVLRQKFYETEEIILSYDKMQSQNIGNVNFRRLLVLNACDGATTSLNNNPTSIGLGATVTNQCQSLISHQWPIDNLAGLIYGTLLAIYLASEESYLNAYEKAVKKFLEGKPSIINFLKEKNILQEAIDTIENSSLDLSSFYYWGSLSYLE